MKKFFAVCFLVCTSLLTAEIREIDSIEDILPEVTHETLVLLDIDDTLIEMPVMLGSEAWRRYVRSVLKTVKTPEEATEIHDKISYFISKRIPYVAIEKTAHGCFEEFQSKQISVFGFTARGKKHWYDMPSSDGEELTILHLKQAGFDLHSLNTHINKSLVVHPSYGQGVFFAYPLEDKGELILELFAQADFRPSKVIFVDDKMKNVHSVNQALEQLKIPSVCFCYRHVALYRPFDPMVAHIQLEKLFFENKILSNDEAKALKNAYSNQNPEEFFLKLACAFGK